MTMPQIALILSVAKLSGTQFTLDNDDNDEGDNDDDDGDDDDDNNDDVTVSLRSPIWLVHS